MKKWAIFGIFWIIIFYPSFVFTAFSDKTIENTKSAVIALYEDENLEYFRASGFFIDSSGTVITAKHVVKKNSQLWARLYDGRKLELISARLQESDDLAIMLPKISGNEQISFPYLKFGNIDNLVIGQPVMAIGNSLGGLWQVLYGNIEHLHRQIITEDNQMFTTIEFNIVIPKGFSGSPLVNENGEAIGMNMANSKASSGYNLSYAISLIEIESFIKKFYQKSPELIKKF